MTQRSYQRENTKLEKEIEKHFRGNISMAWPTDGSDNEHWEKVAMDLKKKYRLSPTIARNQE